MKDRKEILLKHERAMTLLNDHKDDLTRAEKDVLLQISIYRKTTYN